MLKKKHKNPLLGLVYWNKRGDLLMARSLPFAGQITPKVKPREWFYLLFDASRDTFDATKHRPDFIDKFVGSRATRWRTKKALEAKGFLIN